MKQRDLGWVVGILEGEGSFCLNTPMKKYPHYRYARIHVGMTDRDVVARLAKLLGGNVLGPYLKGNNRPMYEWQASGTRAVPLMRLVLPMMGRRRRAKIREILREVV